MKFLGKNLTEQQIHFLVEHLSFESMKNNPAVNREASIAWWINSQPYGETVPNQHQFIRKGIVGQWKEEMSSEMIDKFDVWLENNLKKCPGLTFM